VRCWWIVALSGGCGGLSTYGSVGTPGAGDADTDGDTDADTDADTDSDTDADPGPDEDCTDGTDNDGNGLRDCDDPACFPSCDEDGDGYTADEDCDDQADDVNPGAPEVCDGADNDCDSATDEDADGDGSPVCEDCDDADDNRFPGAGEACDGVDTDCDGADAPSWTWDFEVGPPLQPPFTTSGNANWGVNMTQPHLGAYSGNSGNIGDEGATFLTLQVQMCVAGTIRFWHAGDSELNYDYLKFAIDGVEQGRWSGAGRPYREDTFNLTQGGHTLDWVYSKDVSVSVGADGAWVDDIEILGGSP
jgi:hypothetical protein